MSGLCAMLIADGENATAKPEACACRGAYAVIGY